MLSEKPHNFLSTNQRYKLGPTRATFSPNLDIECNSRFCGILFMLRVSVRLVYTVLVGHRFTEVVSRVMLDTTLGRGIGGNNHNNRDYNMIM